jgi:hypothetical protein
MKHLLFLLPVLFLSCHTPPSPLTDLQGSQGETAGIIGGTAATADSLVNDLKPLPIPEPIKVKAKAVADNLAIIRARYSHEIILTNEAATGYAATITELNAKKVANARLWQVIFVLGAIIAVFVAGILLKLKGLLRI